jgi:hypothetical protein
MSVISLEVQQDPKIATRIDVGGIESHNASKFWYGLVGLVCAQEFVRLLGVKRDLLTMCQAKMDRLSGIYLSEGCEVPAAQPWL